MVRTLLLIYWFVFCGLDKVWILEISFWRVAQPRYTGFTVSWGTETENGKRNMLKSFLQYPMQHPRCLQKISYALSLQCYTYINHLYMTSEIEQGLKHSLIALYNPLSLYWKVISHCYKDLFTDFLVILSKNTVWNPS